MPGSGSEELVYGYKKGVAWGTAVALGVLNGYRGLPAVIKSTPGKNVDASVGQVFMVDATPGEIVTTVDLPAYGRYEDPVRFLQLAQFFGTAGVPATHAAGTTSKDHTLKMASNINGKFGTFGAKSGLGVQEVPSFKPDKVVFKWETGKPLEITISGVGIDEVTTSTTNDGTTFASVTVPTAAMNKRIYSAQTQLWMNAQSGGALAIGDKKGYASIELTLERKLKGFTGSIVSADTNPRDLIDEPTNDAGEEGCITGSLKITFNRATDFAGWADVRALTPQKAEIICTGPIIEGSIPYLFKLQLPHLSPKTSETPHARGIMNNTREYDVYGALAAPTGMPLNTDPCWLFMTNTIATDLLA
jgi:hypothetical protein